MKKIVALLLMSVMMLALTGCGGSDKKDEKAAGSDKKVVLKLSHVFSPDEQLYKSMELVAERIKKKTNGRVEIQCFGQNQLACYKDGLEQVANGANFISVEDPSYLGDYVPDFKPLVGPMLYQSYDEYEKMIETPLVKDMEKKAEEKGVKLLIPIDTVVADDFSNDANFKVVERGGIPDDMEGLDIGPKTRELFADAIKGAKTVVWNGPMGCFEMPNFANGTIAVAKALAELEGATTIIGGGDSAAAVNNLGFGDKMTHISTGGGASLEFLEGKDLPGVVAANDK